MPQHQLLPDEPPVRGLVLQLTDLSLDLIDGLDLVARTVDHKGDSKTRAAVRLYGVEVDYADTLVTTILSTWLYGVSSDIQKQAAAVHKLARKHRAAHGR